MTLKNVMYYIKYLFALIIFIILATISAPIWIGRAAYFTALNFSELVLNFIFKK